MGLQVITEEQGYPLKVTTTNQSTKNGAPVSNALKVATVIKNMDGSVLFNLPSIFSDVGFVTYLAGETKIKSGTISIPAGTITADTVNAKVVVTVQDGDGSPMVVVEEPVVIVKFYPVVFKATATISNT